MNNKAKPFPIYDNRMIVGYAMSIKQAETKVKKMLQHVPKGWKITVKVRDISIIDLPPGYVYSVHP